MSHLDADIVICFDYASPSQMPNENEFCIADSRELINQFRFSNRSEYQSVANFQYI